MAVKPGIHGRDHCPGGADPIPCLSAVAALTGWEAILTGAFSPNSWQNVTADGFFNDGYASPGTSIAVNLDSGQLTFPTKTLVHVHAYAQFADSFASGDVVGVAIAGTWGRITNLVTCGTGGVPGQEKIAVSAGVWHPTTSLQISLQVFHTNASNRILSGAQMTASVEAPLDDSAWTFHA